jgi:predicted dehydrogenase
MNRSTFETQHVPVQLGMIGCGGYALHLLRRIWTRPRTCVVAGAVLQRSDTVGAQACAQRNIPLFSTVEELLDYGVGKFDAIINPTPIHLHRPFTLQCLEAGFPVFLEKPPGATLEDHLALLEASRRIGRPVAVCFNSIYSHTTQQLKKELLAGRYGRIIRIRNLAGWIRTRAYFERNEWAGRLRMADSWVLDGTINNPLSHAVAAALHFAGDEPHSLAEPRMVEAELYRGNPIESEDTSSMRIVTHSGVEILNNFTLCAEHRMDRVTVIECERAVITIKDSEKIEIVFTDGHRETRESYCEDRIEMLEELCYALRNDRPFLCDLESALPFTKTINAAFHSSWPSHTIPSDFLRTIPHETSTRTEILGVNESLVDAHRRSLLLSAAGVAWSRPGRKIPVGECLSASELNHEPPFPYDLSPPGQAPAVSASIAN